MKTVSKKVVSILLGILLVVMMLPLSVLSVVADTVDVSRLSYEISDGEVIITGCVESTAGDLVIPDTIEGYPVTTIGYRAFYDCTSLTSVTISDGVIEIGERAFLDCTGLTTIIIPNSVKEIGEYAFAGCTSLTSVTIPNSVKEVGKGWFYGCKSLASVTIPDGIHEIGYCSFADCKNLASVTIPESVSDISAEAFDGCTDLTDVYYGGTERVFEEVYVGDSNYYLLDATWHYGAKVFNSTDDAPGDDTSNGPWLWVGIGGGTLLVGVVVFFLLKKKPSA
ncbi:MAG: leucine-rich repeat domain-containing protein [Clostridia bacterium]|nr:leucine-rich repeat domain-containing protein [Clostridia bacterium]